MQIRNHKITLNSDGIMRLASAAAFVLAWTLLPYGAGFLLDLMIGLPDAPRLPEYLEFWAFGGGALIALLLAYVLLSTLIDVEEVGSGV